MLIIIGSLSFERFRPAQRSSQSLSIGSDCTANTKDPLPGRERRRSWSQSLVTLSDSLCFLEGEVDSRCLGGEDGGLEDV